MNGEGTRKLINTCAVNNLGNQVSSSPCCYERERASAAAVCIDGILYPNHLDVGCYSQALNLVGDKLSTPTYLEYISYSLDIPLFP